MTGIYLRVIRDGEWKAVEIEHLTREELEELGRDRPLEGWAWVTVLVEWIKGDVREG